MAESANPTTSSKQLYKSWQPSWRCNLPELIVGLTIVIIVATKTYGTAYYGLSLSAELLGTDQDILLPLHLLLLAVVIARPLFWHFDSKHVLGSHHIYSITGRCSLKKERIELSFEDILGVRSNQTIIERILGVGSILVWTASSENPEITMRGIANPEDVVQQIRMTMDQSKINDKKST